MKLTSKTKLTLWFAGVVACSVIGIFGYYAFHFVFTWTGFVNAEGYGGRYYKEIGEFESLSQCQQEADLDLRVDTDLSDGKVADMYFCGRGCWVNPMNRNATLDDYSCLEKVNGTETCAKLGDFVIPVAFTPPGSHKFTRKCCEGLEAISDPIDAANGAAPGGIICAACGDGICDSKFENSFNCPEDCPRSK